MGAYPNPVAAMDGLIACLAPGRNVQVIRGSAGTGVTIPCCRAGSEEGAGILRIETGQTRPANGEPSARLSKRTNCGELAQEIVVTFKQCFPTNTGKTAETNADLEARGLTVIMSWWQALTKIACCDVENQLWSLISRDDLEPDAGCAGWTMTLETTVAFCAPCP